MEAKLCSAPIHYSSVAAIKIPFGDNEPIQAQTSRSGPHVNPLSILFEPMQKSVDAPMLKEIGRRLKFGKEVMKERSSHTLPYDRTEILKVYDYNEMISTAPEQDVISPGGRFDARQYLRSVPCQFKRFSSPRTGFMSKRIKTVTERYGEIPPVEYKKTEMQKSPVKKHFFRPKSMSAPRKSVMSSFAMQYYMPSEKRGKRPLHWDEKVLCKLNKDTACWIVFDNLEPGLQKDRLDRFLRTKFGTKISTTNLVREDAKESNIKTLASRKEERQKAKLEQEKQQKKQEKICKVQNNPTLQQTFAQYYKLPRYLTQERKKVTTVEREFNQTTQNITIKHLAPPPPTKMEDILNPAAKNYIYATENAFEQQLYTNQAKPVFQLNCDRSRIIMDDFSEYQSNVQTIYPPDSTRWSQGTQKNVHSESRAVKCEKGMRRWTGLPQPADFASERGVNPPKDESTKVELFNVSKPTTMLNNAPLVHIIEVWRSKWKLAGSWQEVTMGDVLLDLDNIHGHVRLAAVSACAMAALHKMPVMDIAVLAVLPKIDVAVLENKADVGHLFVDLLEKVRSRLHDPHARVQLAAALCLYALSEINDEVINILEYNLENGIPTDRFACAQCLALKGSTDARVVELIIHMLLETDEQEQATSLLIHISQYTRLAHSLLAEQLNSSCWKDRVLACNVLSKLIGNINRDLVNKMSTLMWEDWSSEVRKAASKALGKTGHGRDVHFELREKLIEGNERVCADVLRKIAHIGIMTATLLPEYLKCFSAEYTSVRLESVRSAAQLRIKDEKVIRELLRLIQFDPSWKVKAHAIKAIGEIGVVSEKIKHVLVWALRFENEPGVRLEACLAIRKLECDDQDVVHVLQDRVLVEPFDPVKEEVKGTLEAFGMDGPQDNTSMIRYIKSEVKKLCKKNIVAAKVLSLEPNGDSLDTNIQYTNSILNEDSASDKSENVDSHAEVSLAWAKIAARNGSATTRNHSSSGSPTSCLFDRTVIIDLPRHHFPSITEEITSSSETDDSASYTEWT